MEGRRISMVVAILVGLTSINVGGVKGLSNCDAYLDPCDGDMPTEECCNSLNTLVTKDVPCFCTLTQGDNVTQDVQLIQDACGITVRPSICSKGHKNEAFKNEAFMPKWAVGLILLCIITIIIPGK
ncbi:non-specific lipid transfer protein GPI-anchored 8-like [Nymphaea colorata]|uniref:non-specific lipid transfer protein GPI-anchored 8-like n=1 Tax=Nymphaea colorata TaxID=210225 RepID=UPI00214E74CC|nr:non-specific lipid transfer protein GPI-anchored 8-like [Nymphaea colorata]